LRDRFLYGSSATLSIVARERANRCIDLHEVSSGVRSLDTLSFPMRFIEICYMSRREGAEDCGDWSTGRELNPRILVLQTSALATSPPVLILLPAEKSLSLALNHTHCTN
jgi:hypothetical protein